MNKNPTWKFVLIVGLVAAAIWLVYPPKDKLQGGLDLVGGTSLIYEIDTTGLDPDERKNLAQNMIPNLRKRVDPKGVADIYMWPQGDTRIEIQLPLSSIETGDRRKEYAQAREQIEAQNIKMTDVKQALSFDPNTRREVFATFAAGSQDSQAILDNLADIYDRREQRLRQSETLAREKTQLMEKIGAQGVSTAYIESIAPQWATLLGKSRTQAISTFVDANIRPIDPNESKPTEDNAKFEEQKKLAKQFVAQYTTTHSNWAQAVNELAEPETGLSAQWDAAVGELLQINLNIAQLEDIMEMPLKSTLRYERIKEIEQKFPRQAKMIEALIDAHTKYAAVGGRLDDPEDLKRMLKGAGVLEFRIIPTENDGKTSADELRGYRDALLTKGPKAASTAKYIWIEIEDPETFPENFKDIGPPAVETFGQKSYVLASNLKNEKMLQGGEKKWKLKKAYSSNDRMGRRAIGFTHDAVGGKIFYNVTKSNPGRPLAILLDNRIISAPVIDPERPIGTHGTITGGGDGFRQTEVDDMVNKLNAGSFPARLSEFPIAEKTIGPQAKRRLVPGKAQRVSNSGKNYRADNRTGQPQQGRNRRADRSGSRRGIHAHLLSSRRFNRQRGTAHEHTLCIGHDGHVERKVHLARYRRFDPDYRHERGRKRTHLRTNTRRTNPRLYAQNSDSKRISKGF